MRKATNHFAIAVLLGFACSAAFPAFGQNIISEPAPPALLYRIFFHMHAKEAELRGSGRLKGATMEATATRLGIAMSEVLILDSAAKQFVQTEQGLAQQARSYAQNRKNSGLTVDPGPFFQMQQDLAMSTMAGIQAKLSPASFAALQKYLESELRPSIVRRRL